MLNSAIDVLATLLILVVATGVMGLLMDLIQPIISGVKQTRMMNKLNKELYKYILNEIRKGEKENEN